MFTLFGFLKRIKKRERKREKKRLLANISILARVTESKLDVFQHNDLKRILNVCWPMKVCSEEKDQAQGQ